MAEWKRPLLIGVGWGLGTVVGVALVVGGFLWYEHPPRTPSIEAIMFRFMSDGKGFL